MCFYKDVTGYLQLMYQQPLQLVLKKTHEQTLNKIYHGKSNFALSKYNEMKIYLVIQTESKKKRNYSKKCDTTSQQTNIEV